MPSPLKTVVIPAAGLGTRFLPATKIVPKELIPIVDKPAVQYIVEECLRAGIEKVVFVISKGKENIPAYFKRDLNLERVLKKKGKDLFLKQLNDISSRIKFSVVYQHKPRGLGDAVLKAKNLVKEDYFAVILPDDVIVSVTPAIMQLKEVHEARNASVVCLERVPMDSVSSYGVIAGPKISDRLYKISKIVEKPKIEDAPSDLIVVGRYLLSSEIFDILEETKPGHRGEIQLTDAIQVLLGRRELYGFEFYGDRYDLGDRIGFIRANISFAMRDEKLKSAVLESIKKWS